MRTNTQVGVGSEYRAVGLVPKENEMSRNGEEGREGEGCGMGDG